MQRLSLPAQPCTSSAALPRARWAAARPAPSSSWRAPAGRRRQRAAPPQAAQQQQEQPPQQPQQQQQPEQLPEPPSGFPGGSGLPVAASLVAAAALLTAVGSPVAGQALAMEVHAEPANALSLPTWMVHVSSVVEWTIAMGLMWRYGEVSGNPRWKGLAWGMLPCLGSAMCACTWHFYYNAPELQFLVALQAALTVLGNLTCWAAAYRIYQWGQEEGGQQA